MLATLENIWNLLLIVVGFGFVIFIHELGHFVAARWAGIRVHAFALGFGRAICSWRKGLGFRWGSSEPEYMAALKREREGIQRKGPGGQSPTEYRLNWFPFGGYVKMLGQEDANPGAVSNEPDSFSSKPVWKRMVVISAGVVMNVVLAAVLFVVVFMAGMREQPPIVGGVLPGSPAERSGIRAGDAILSINGSRTETFKDLFIETAMAERGREMEIRVRRPGGDGPLTLRATPEVDKQGTGLLYLGVMPPQSATLASVDEWPADAATFQRLLQRAGLSSVRPGMRLVQVNGEPVRTAPLPDGSTATLLEDLTRAVETSGGEPVRVVFEDPEEPRAADVALSLTPAPSFQSTHARIGEAIGDFEHLMGLTPAMMVESAGERAVAQGLRDGDIFVRIGDAYWPSVPAAIAEIQRHKGGRVPLAVLRDGREVPLEVEVDQQGRIGFYFNSAWGSPLVATTPPLAPDGEGRVQKVAADRLFPKVLPGMRFAAVNDTPVEDWRGLRAALRGATAGAAERGEGATVSIAFAPRDGSAPAMAQEWALSAEDVEALHGLTWRIAGLEALFAPVEFIMRAEGPVQAVGMGVRQTNRVLMMTYLTFLRLFEGSVKVEHLKGPVGIAHVGSQFAEQGFIYLLFFLALISANLAVINFLPIPIVDGGMFVMLLVEGITRRPVPIVVQNVATLIGLVFIGAVFLIVTFNDVMNLIR